MANAYQQGFYGGGGAGQQSPFQPAPSSVYGSGQRGFYGMPQPAANRNGLPPKVDSTHGYYNPDNGVYVGPQMGPRRPPTSAFAPAPYRL